MSFIKRNQKALLIILVAALSCGMYLNILHNEYFTDDLWQVLRNEYIKSFRNIPDVFLSPVWSLTLLSDAIVGVDYYRPMMYLFYMAVYKFSGLDPFGYHVLSIILHSINAVLVFIVVSMVLSTWQRSLPGTSGEQQPISPAVPFLAAVIFASNPINSEVVNWIAAVPELSFVMFLLLAFIFYDKNRILISSALFFLSMMSKETAIVLPLLLVAYDVIFKRVDIMGNVLAYFVRFIPYLAVAALYLGLRSYVMGPGISSEEVRILDGYQYALNVPVLIFFYLKKLVFPTGIYFFNYLRFDAAIEISDPRVVLTTVFFIGAVALLLRLRKVSATFPILAFSLFWILAPLAPVLLLGWIKGFPLFESRYLYLSSIGYGVVFSLVARALWRVLAANGKGGRVPAGPGRLALVLAIVAVITAYTVGTVQRNFVWKEPYTIWQDTLSKDPDHVIALNSFGTETARKGNLDDAIEYYKRALELDPENTKVHNNIGVAYAKKGMLDEAVSSFSTALKIEPDNVDARNNLDKALDLIWER